MSSAGIAVIVLIIAVAAVSVVYVSSTQGEADQLNSQSQQIATLESQIQKLSAAVSSGKGAEGNVSLPVMNQAPTTRTIRETWYLSPSAHQDRFDPSFIVVNQGDTVKLTFIDNDTVAHDFVIGPAYNIIVNATVPGLVNDLTGQRFSTPAANNSPGVVVKGTPGNVSASYSFVARYAGIYEFVCTYHVQVGMIGYLVVLPNLAYTSAASNPTTTTVQTAATGVPVSILAGAGTPGANQGFSPDRITVVIGVNNTVVWTNNDNQPHTVTANGESFDSGLLAPGATFTYTFTTPGVYGYHCTYHPWMTGTVVVKEAS
jgi:plastocyanin